jgi:hypothetical protein
VAVGVGVATGLGEITGTDGIDGDGEATSSAAASRGNARPHPVVSSRTATRPRVRIFTAHVLTTGSPFPDVLNGDLSAIRRWPGG